MTEERREIAQKYVHDMINSFVEDPHSAIYHDSFDPPYVSFYSPDIERLLEKACHNDRYSVKHPQLAEFNGFDPHIYDIEGHRVRTLKGMIVISIDGVAFDRIECYNWLRLGKKRTNKWALCNALGRPMVSPNKFRIHLPPK